MLLPRRVQVVNVAIFSVMYVVYVLMSLILLLNLLIAVFNDTYADIKDNAEVEWRATWAKTIMRIQRKLPLRMVRPWCTSVLKSSTVVENREFDEDELSSLPLVAVLAPSRGCRP